MRENTHLLRIIHIKNHSCAIVALININNFWKERKMKAKHQQPAVSLPNPLCTALFAVTMLVLLASGLALADNIYVSSYNEDNIYKFDSSGIKSTFASGLDGPTGLAFDSSGYLYVADYKDMGRIMKLDLSGNMSTFASGFTSDLDSPFGLAFDSSGYLYVANQGGPGTIEKFDASGNGTIFASGLHSPAGLAFDSSGNLFVTSHSSSTIEKFDASGNGTIFASGLNGPTGLAFDSSGNFYAASWKSGTIEKFDSSGNMSLFASGLGNPSCIATQIPEPASAILIGLGCLFARLRRRQR